jgi:hypothetical protein
VSICVHPWLKQNMKTPNETECLAEAYHVLEDLNQIAKDDTSIPDWLLSFPEVHAWIKKRLRPESIRPKARKCLSRKELALERKKMDQVLQYIDDTCPVHRNVTLLSSLMLARVVNGLYQRGTFDADGNFTPPPRQPAPNDWLGFLDRALRGSPRHN